MTKILDITAATTDEQIENAISFLDMREMALAERGKTTLELHDVDGVTVLYSPDHLFACANQMSPGVGTSLVIDAGDAASPEEVADRWFGDGLNAEARDILGNEGYAETVAACLRGRDHPHADSHARDDARRLQRNGIADAFLAAVDRRAAG